MIGRGAFAFALVLSALAPVGARAGDAGAVFGGIAGGMLGGVIAGTIIANSRPAVVYRQPRAARSGLPPRRYATRARAPGPAAPQGAAVINASADPFAKTQAPATTSVSAGR